MLVLICAALFCFGVAQASGQSPEKDPELSRLKDEIQRRESVERNPDIMASDKETNRLNLEAARAKLRALLTARIAGKMALRASLGDAITPAESRSIASAVESLEAELRSLNESSTANAPSTPPRTDPQLTVSTAPPQTSSAVDSQSSSVTSTGAADSSSTASAGASSAASGTAPGQTATSGTGVGSTAASSFAANASTKTELLPIRSCTEVASLAAANPKSVSFIEGFFCFTVKSIQDDKTGEPIRPGAPRRAPNPQASFNLQRDFFNFLIFMLAREGRAQYVLEAENERMDKQVGSDASSSGSTSLVSKGSVPSILGFAVDSGALTQTFGGSTVTFRGNLAGIAKAVAGKGYITGYDEDSAGARLLRKVSFSLSYDPSRGEQPGTFLGTKQQISGYSVRLDLYNKRDPRDSRYRQDWNEFLAGVSQQLAGQTQHSLDVMTNLGQNRGSAAPKWQDPALQEWYVVTDTAVRDAAPGEVEAIFKERLNNLPLNLSDATRAELRSFDARFRPWLEGREEILAKVAKAPIVTFEYLNDRPLNASSISRFRFIAETGLSRGFDLTFNGSLALFDERPATAESRIRDFQFALQLDAQMGEMGMGLGKPVLSFAGRYERLSEDITSSDGLAIPNTKGDIAVGQLKFTIPIKNSGIRIPISVSFANRTELLKEKEVRGNFGFTFDLDTLFARFNPFSR
ncbi:MAG TPA: hypothetical protein VJS44_09850 [Pyrinomonadaceae bacterium]|nr:hypothetical protein [Pyrinomonadaceae bacterium]